MVQRNFKVYMLLGMPSYLPFLLPIVVIIYIKDIKLFATFQCSIIFYNGKEILAVSWPPIFTPMKYYSVVKSREACCVYGFIVKRF